MYFPSSLKGDLKIDNLKVFLKEKERGYLSCISLPFAVVEVIMGSDCDTGSDDVVTRVAWS